MSKGKKVLIGSFIVILIAAFVTLAILKNTDTSSVFGGGGYPVKVTQAEKGSISSSISSSGVLEEVEKAELYTDTPLKVSKVLVEKGQKVAKGQKLLEFDLDDLNSQLHSLKVNRDNQQDAMDSKVSDIQIEIALNNVKAAQKAYDDAKKDAQKAYDDAKKTYEDNKALYDAGVISKSDLDMSEKAMKQVNTDTSAIENATLTWQNAVESAKNGKQTAEDSLKVTNMQISDLEKKIEKIEAQTICPMDGVLSELNVSDGSFTSSMQSVYRIINPDKLQVRAKVKEFDIKNVAVGQTVRITGDAIDKNTVINGKVADISPVATVNRTTSGDETVIEVTVSVDGSGGILKPGLNVTCDIFTVDKKDALVVPMEALIPDKDDNTLVFTVDKKTNTLVEKKVTVGINSDMNVEILDGLKEGDTIVLNPQPTYTEGMKVKTQDN